MFQLNPDFTHTAHGTTMMVALHYEAELPLNIIVSLHFTILKFQTMSTAGMCTDSVIEFCIGFHLEHKY